MIARGRRSGDEAGQALVEFALILPIFVFVLLGVLDLGRAVYAYATLNNTAREGARVAIVDQTVDHIRERAAQHAVALGVPEAAIDVEFVSADGTGPCTYLTDADTSNDAFAATCLVIVSVPYDYVATTPFLGNVVGTISMVGESTMRVETFCREPAVAGCPRGS